jgi:exodeoxyribonuclease-1
VELDEDEIKKRLFTEGKNRLQTQVLAFNKSPMFTYEERRISSPKLLDQMQIDKIKCMQHLTYIRDNKEIIEKKIESIYKKDSDREPTIDADQSLYDNFISNKDREICDEIQDLSVDQMSSFRPNFEDRKLSKLFLNFKARNYPETLTEEEQEDWFEIVQSRVQSGENGYLSFEKFEKSLNRLKEVEPHRLDLWQELEEYANKLL